ncbi:sigma 54 modulation protein/ribosomal protein S30EA [Paludibacter propionicigenes WB4]|uniref:Sigma 54 modulation protein/ribosomal protein S30EA n=1 Tax=Paludibacter propionicigenes (strain DSM 17365 / JCM 13257 / WB4) TaxID=694427 RepID=E4T562_PALPW|nr:ribosome-associated translation inhibitor RaiA [Paludibacter propionicigenes]ADQ79856.1 sigma 54 modulation protein/ribosomal protein S30EA [Paludibacter propionicigenes WB4]
MKLRIQSINFDATTALESYINKKALKLEKFFDEIINIEVYLKVVKPETSTNKEAEIKVSIPNVDFFASKTCDSFEEAVDLTLDALDKQIRKYKEKATKN